MTIISKVKNSKIQQKKTNEVDIIKVLSDFTRQDIEKSYNIESTNGTEAYYSNRYGWTLRKIIS